MRIYCAGPMSGYPRYNAPAFAEAAVRLRALGHDVVTPLELNAAVWARHHDGETYDPEVHKVAYGDPIISEMYAEDLHEVCTREGVALLPGWQYSRGGLGEVHVAQVLGKHFLDAMTGAEMIVKLNLTPMWAGPVYEPA